MAKRKRNQNQSQEEIITKTSDTEFGEEVPQSKKARKRAARERKKK